MQVVSLISEIVFPSVHGKDASLYQKIPSELLRSHPLFILAHIDANRHKSTKKLHKRYFWTFDLNHHILLDLLLTSIHLHRP